MAVVEAGPVFESTRAYLRNDEFDQLEPSIEELEAIEAEEAAGELYADPLELMIGYVKNLRGEPFAARDVEQFQPELDAVGRKHFMQKLLRRLQADEETADRLRHEGNTKGRKYWLASELTGESLHEGPDWFESHQNIELRPFAIYSQAELASVRRTLRQLHSMREAGIQQINGQNIKEIFAVCNSSIKTYHEHIAISIATKEREKIRIRDITISSVPSDDDTGKGDFTEYANCRGVDPDLFFPEKGASVKEAQRVCSGCVVRDECGEYALARGERFGIWGGMSERERRRIRKARMLAANEEIS